MRSVLALMPHAGTHDWIRFRVTVVKQRVRLDLGLGLGLGSGAVVKKDSPRSTALRC